MPTARPAAAAAARSAALRSGPSRTASSAAPAAAAPRPAGRAPTNSRAQRAEQTRRLLLDTAQRLFASQGYDGTSLQMIADDMGVTKAAVYYYFRTKADILEALMSRPLGAIAALLDAAEQVPDRAERIRIVIGGFIDQLIGSRELAGVKYSDPVMQHHSAVLDQVTALRDRGMQVLFGDQLTPYQRVAYLTITAIGDTIPLLEALTDDEASEALRAVCFRLLADEV
jgi:AcrR family transcriptional regulator